VAYFRQALQDTADTKQQRNEGDNGCDHQRAAREQPLGIDEALFERLLEQ
jgi:hypothetical protein